MRLAFLTDGGDLVGQSSVMPISPGPPGSAYLGYWASRAHAGRGLMHETLALALHEACTDAGLTRVEANIVPENERSVRLAESLGMRHEGVALEYLEISGEMRDHAHYALLRREWVALGDDPVGTLLSGRR